MQKMKATLILENGMTFAGRSIGSGEERICEMVFNTSMTEMCIRDRVMAFGDAGNDLELLAWAGWSFAMANASAEAKKAARYETGSNAEGGVGMAVERWLLAE